MNGSTLKTIREAMGLPIAWLAGVAGVQERTARYWESGRMAVPADVAQTVLDLERAAAVMTTHGAQAVRDLVAEHGRLRDPLRLVRYADDDDLARYRPDMKGLPATYHAAVLARVRWALAADGIEVETHTLDAPAYEAWRKATGQPDGEALRAQFIGITD